MTEPRELLASVRGDDIEFATLRPPGSRFTTIDRRVVVTSPPVLVELSLTGDIGVLDGLVELLRDPDTAWAAEVVLAAMTRREEKQVEAYSTRSDEWWQTFGRDAHERWSDWLDETRGQLRWDAATDAFVRDPAPPP